MCVDVENEVVAAMADLCQALYVKEKAEEAGTSVVEATSICERLKQIASDTKKTYDAMVAEETMAKLPHQTKTDLLEIERLTAKKLNEWKSANFCANVFCMKKKTKLPTFSDPTVEVIIHIDNELKFISHPTKPNIHYLFGKSDQGMIVVVHNGSMYF